MLDDVDPVDQAYPLYAEVERVVLLPKHIGFDVVFIVGVGRALIIATVLAVDAGHSDASDTETV